MYLLPYLPTVSHDCHITCNNGRYPGFISRINNLVHQRNILTVNDCIDREIALDTVFITCSSNLFQVIDSKCCCRMGTHIQFFYPEVYTVSTSLYGSSETLA